MPQRHLVPEHRENAQMVEISHEPGTPPADLLDVPRPLRRNGSTSVPDPAVRSGRRKKCAAARHGMGSAAVCDAGAVEEDRPGVSVGQAARRWAVGRR
ncbi:hypothetical protein GCM10009634_60950 [Saccharothrix xinjiangensis]